MIELEIWRDIPGYEGKYQVSDSGRVKNTGRNKILSGSIARGYRQFTLTSEGTGKTFRASQLVAMAFLGHIPNGNISVVDHINGDRADNRVENLQIVTNRENSSVCFRTDKEDLSSEYVGVSWVTRDSVWTARIQYEGVNINLGSFNSEIKASEAYQLALRKIKYGIFNLEDYKPNWTSNYKGVSFYKSRNKWMAYIRVDSKQKTLGYFETELEAYEARQKALEQIK